MSNVQMFWSLCAECVEFLSQRISGAVLVESRHGKCQTDIQGLYQRKRSDRVLTTYSLLSPTCCKESCIFNLWVTFPVHLISLFCRSSSNISRRVTWTEWHTFVWDLRSCVFPWRLFRRGLRVKKKISDIVCLSLFPSVCSTFSFSVF